MFKPRFMKETLKLLTIMAAFSLFSCACGAAPTYPQDNITAKDGSRITLTFYAHASISVAWGGHTVYFDPVGDQIDWGAQPRADLVLITHDHYDHLDTAVVKTLNGTGAYVQMKPGETLEPFEGVSVRAVPAYNISEGHLQFHPKERGDAGYILTVGGTSIYVAGDTEDNEDVLSLRDVDIAFLPVNQPYTMTVEQCIRVVEAIRPAIFYPYHFGGSGVPTDVEALASALEGVTEVRLRPLE